MEFRPRSQTASFGMEAANVPSVSQDLLQIYERTKTASTEPSVSAIVSSCKKVLATSGRPKVDREYAVSLIAWALNRRGEMRSDRAAKLVASGEFRSADQLDRLAAEDFKTAIDYSPGNWRTHHNYAISLAMKGAYKRAIDELDLAIELKPDYANSYFNRGELYFETEDYASAISSYSQAINIDDSDPQYLNSRAHSKFMLEAYDDALEDYRLAVNLGSDSATYQTDLADAYQYLGRWKDAARTYQAAVGANNKYARAYQNAAWLMATCPEADIRNPELALAAAKKAIELSERSSRALDTLAAALAAGGKQTEATEIQIEAIELASDDGEKTELVQRLRLYQQGSVFRQAKPMLAASEHREIDNLRIRTASGDAIGSR